MKTSKLFMGTAPFLLMLALMSVSPAKASVQNNQKMNSSLLEFKQGNAESTTVSSDRKKKKKKKKRVHCEAY